MYRDFDMPVVPLATNLGLFWPEEKYEKHAGTATLDFLEPIPTGLPKEEFMVRLEAVIEARTGEHCRTCMVKDSCPVQVEGRRVVS